MESKKHRSIDGVVVTTGVMANLLGVSECRIRQMVEEGIIPRKANGAFELVPVVKQYILECLVAVADTEKNEQSEVEEEMEIKNAEDLRTQAPAVYDEVFNAGVAAEKARLKAIDELAGSVDTEFFKQAKYEDGMTAEKLALTAMKEGKTAAAAYLGSVAEDATKANEVPGAAAPGTPGTADELAAAQAHVKEIAEKTAKGR